MWMNGWKTSYTRKYISALLVSYQNENGRNGKKVCQLSDTITKHTYAVR